ncbi:hypothetical protein [Pseudotenacibaculum haliotis]|uniref:Uncharacterized protein n=1 Tax=Pseudotenacibaculum haliotis TaxID=1862138 RepID=A0ABW5LVM1_9FLAO
MDDLQESYKSSLLYDLSKKEIQQIFTDYKYYGEISHVFFIDAYDILSFIDPYNLLYEGQKDSVDKTYVDSFYAMNALLNHRKGMIYLFDEYDDELDVHKKKFNEISYVNEKLNDLINNNAAEFDEEKARQFISEFYSEIFFILKRRDKSFVDLYNDIFENKKVKRNYKYEELFFGDDDIFFTDANKENIGLIYDLFPKDKRGYSSLIDAICIYKIILLNYYSIDDGVRYMYFSSAKKTKILFEKLTEVIDKKEWTWLKKIMKKFPGEELFFHRNNNYNFGYIIYNVLKGKKYRNSQIIFEDYCDRKEESSPIYDILLKTREKVENESIFLDSKLTDDELAYSARNNKNVDSLLIELKKLYKTKEDGKKIDFIKINLFTYELAQELIKNLNRGEDVIIDRGQDNIISLFNALPPLFMLNDYLLEGENIYKRYQSEIENLIIYASTKKHDKNRISQHAVFKLLQNYQLDSSLLNDVDNLIIIFLIIFIKYTSDNNEDSNYIAYQECNKFTHVIKKKLKRLNAVKNKNSKQKKHYRFILRELSVLSLWSMRRKGNDVINLYVIKRDEKINEEFIKEYGDDYRFKLSYFLIGINYLYDFKELNRNNLNEINIYLSSLIERGEACKNEIERIPSYEENKYLPHTYKTVINSLSFVYCAKLDVLLSTNTEVKTRLSKKGKEIYNKILELKKLRKDLKSSLEQDYDDKKIFHPVFPYVEAYIEYLEAFMDKKADSQKLKFAKESIELAIKNLKTDKINRPFFLKCCKRLRKLIVKMEKKKSDNFESFILSIDQ